MSSRILFVAMMLLPWSTVVRADEAGESYYLALSHEEMSQDSEGGMSSSGGHDDLIERIIEVHNDSRVVEYDLPLDPGEERKPINWQFPARFLIDADGKATLLNADALAERNAVWRRLAGIEQAACGSWYFTWNAFQVECDPQSVLWVAEKYSLRFEPLEEGAQLPYGDTLSPGTLRDCTNVGEPISYCADYRLDSEKIRQSKIESDKVVAQILGEDAAGRASIDRSSEQIDGTLRLKLTLDHEGRVWKRVTTTEVTTTSANGDIETSTSREELVRTLVEPS